MHSNIILMDTTFRDGQQSPLMFDTYKFTFSLSERLLLIKGLIELGVTYFEFFSPVVGSKETNYFKDIKKYVEQDLQKQVIFIAHCRCNEKDIELALKQGFTGLNLYMGTSENSIKYNHGKNLEEVSAIALNIIKKYRILYPKLYIRFSGEDAFRTNIEDLIKVYKNIAPFVDTLGMPDTVGIATPEVVKKVVKELKHNFNNNLETHFHNDRGLALINTLTAVKNGANIIDCSIWGMAERSGITSTTGILLNLYLYKKSLVKKYNLAICYPLNVLMASILNNQVPYTEPVSLTNRTHIAGVHTGAVLKNSKSYEGIDLSIFGVNKNQLLLGPLSGWNIIYYFLKEVLYYKVSEDDAKRVTEIFKNDLTPINKFNNPETVLESICNNLNFSKRVSKIAGTRRVENLD